MFKEMMPENIQNLVESISRSKNFSESQAG